MQRLIADIGGTNARFARVSEVGLPTAARTLRVADHPGLAEAALAYLDGERVAEAVLAVATPVESDDIRFTNAPWSFRTPELKERLGVGRIAVINDFVAQALAMPHLGQGEFEQIGAGEALPGRPMAVIGAGTGLGVSGLVPGPNGAVALATEGGHVSFAPGNEREHALLRCLAARFGHVSDERVLSGPGLLNLAQALAEVEGVPLQATTPEAVTREAREGSAICLETMRLFSELLGSAAGDLALTYGARGGVYLAGGLCLSLGELFDRAAFRRRFVDKGRMRRYLEPIPTFLVTRGDTGLLGAARCQLPA